MYMYFEIIRLILKLSDQHTTNLSKTYPINQTTIQIINEELGP